MKSRPNLKNFIYLTGSGLVIQLAGTVYRIWLARRIGPEGLGILQMIYPVYRLLSSIAVLGLPAVLTKWVAEYLAVRDYAGIHTLRTWSLRTVSLVAVGFGLLLYFAAPWLGHSVLLDPRVAIAIRFVAPAIPFSALSAVYRGYFQGFSRMGPAALSEITEQITEITAAYLGIAWFSTSLFFPPYASPVFGLTMGEVACLATLLMYGRFLSPITIPLDSAGANPSPLPLGAIFHYTWPLLLNQIVVTISNASEGILIPRLLHLSGIPIAVGTGLFGELSGMAGPVAYFPLFFIAPLGAVLFPQVSAALKTGVSAGINKKIRLFYLYAAIICFGGIILVFPAAGSISRALYGTDAPAALIRLLLCGLPFTVCAFFNITLLTASGATTPILKLSLWAVGLKTASLIAFTSLLGIRGAAWAFNITQIFTALVSTAELMIRRQYLDKHLDRLDGVLGNQDRIQKRTTEGNIGGRR